MTSSARRIVRDLLPPALTRALTRPDPGALRFEDGFASWPDAVAAAGGYDESSILDSIGAATQEVVAGRAVFERDGVTFDHHEYRWPVAAGLLRSAARHGHLNVLDFGGSLGSSYRQYLPLLDGIEVAWGVVEQDAFVAAGQAFTTESLHFFTTISQCVAALQPNTALLSSVLQYLPDPYTVLAELNSLPIDTVIIDRTPMLDGAVDVVTVQHVPSSIYAASYPAWLLSRDRLISALPGWSLVDEFPGIEPDMRTTGGVDFSWRGLLLTRESGA